MICSDEGLTLETSAFQSLYGGQFTLSTPLINQIFVFHSPTDAASQFLQKTNPLYSYIHYPTIVGNFLKRTLVTFSQNFTKSLRLRDREIFAYLYPYPFGGRGAQSCCVDFEHLVYCRIFLQFHSFFFLFVLIIFESN